MPWHAYCLTVNLRGKIFYKSVQILAYSDDIDIIGRTQEAMKETFTNLDKAVKKTHLQINQGKKICQLPKKSAQTVLLI